MDQHVKGAQGGTLTGDEWLSLNEQGRAIAVEYRLNPAVRELESSAAGRLIARRFAEQGSVYAGLATGLPALRDFFAAIPGRADPAGTVPFWFNDWFPPLDAITLCLLLRQIRPKRYVEIGSGNSTKFARALIDHLGLDTDIISIDPIPRAEIDRLCDEVIRSPLENMATAIFSDLTNDDMLFVDNSHHAFQNSDVTIFFMDILPALAEGAVYGIHDIFLPFDYPRNFVNRFYNEQYLLAAYLIGGSSDDVLFPVHYVARNEQDAVPFRRFGEEINLGLDVLNGGAFWARRRRGADRPLKRPVIDRGQAAAFSAPAEEKSVPSASGSATISANREVGPCA